MRKQENNHTTTIALIANDIVGKEMAGPGIRVWEFACVLQKYCHVQLIVPPLLATRFSTPLSNLPKNLSVIICSKQAELRAAVELCDVIVTRGVILTAYPFLARMHKPLVLDMYNTALLESLQQLADAAPGQQITTFERNLASINHQLIAADFILCASEKQRDYWLGHLAGLGRINPSVHQQDHTLRQLIDVVPFGLPHDRPAQTMPVLKGVRTGIKATDKVILWGGGIWNWLDAETLIRSMALIRSQRSDVKLFFMGIKRPNSGIAKTDALERVLQLSEQLELTGDTVFFNDWVPYDERQNYLLEADVGVSLHLDHIETRFSFRTRLLDHVWTGLPTVATQGDVLGELLAQNGVAWLVPPQNAEAVARAILDLLDTENLRPSLAPKFHRISQQFHWETVLNPLVKFCETPYLAPDKQTAAFVPPTESRSLLGKSWRAYQLGGIAGFWREFQAYWQWQKVRK